MNEAGFSYRIYKINGNLCRYVITGVPDYIVGFILVLLLLSLIIKE